MAQQTQASSDGKRAMQDPRGGRARLVRALGLAILLAAGPVAAQDGGTIDLGAFVGYTSFAASYDLQSALSYGARAGAYVSPRVGVEIEANTGTASRPNGLADRSFRFLDARLLLVPVRTEGMSVLLGVGVGRLVADIDGSADDQSDAMHVLVGGRIALSGRTALRLDYTRYFDGAIQHGSLKAGLGVLLHPLANRPHALSLGARP